MSAKILNSDFYLICPLVINDWVAFSKNIEHRMWSEYSKYRSYSIKPLLASFLGACQADDFPISKGLQFQGKLQNSGDKLISSLVDTKNSFFFVNKKGGKNPRYWRLVLFVFHNSAVCVAK